jgi:hypothetical protein
LTDNVNQVNSLFNVFYYCHGSSLPTSWNNTKKLYACLWRLRSIQFYLS